MTSLSFRRVKRRLARAGEDENLRVREEAQRDHGGSTARGREVRPCQQLSSWRVATPHGVRHTKRSFVSPRSGRGSISTKDARFSERVARERMFGSGSRRSWNTPSVFSATDLGLPRKSSASPKRSKRCL